MNLVYFNQQNPQLAAPWNPVPATFSLFRPSLWICNLIPRKYWVIDKKEGAFLPNKKPREPGNEVAIYEQINHALVDSI